MRLLRRAIAALPVLVFPAVALAQGEPKAPPPAGSAAPPAAPAPQPPAPPADTQPQPSATAPAEPPPPPPPQPAPAQRPSLINGSISPNLLPKSAAPTTTSAAPGATRDVAHGEIGAKPSDVYAEDWWNFGRPVLELHGYFRTRAELFHNFYLGRNDTDADALWPHPADSSYSEWNRTTQTMTPKTANFCGGSSNPGGKACMAKTQSSANLRFRLAPELHISDNLRILSQIDLLDNVVMGSTPEGYTNTPASGGGYWRSSTSGYVPMSALANTQEAPTANQNSWRNSIAVKRVWGEYVTPIGQLRFGRMPDHWGLGMLHNSGDTYDSDYQSTVDRFMFVTGVKPLDLFIAGAWDFPNEGSTSAILAQQQGQPYDVAQNDDVSQYSLIIARRRNPTLQRLDLAQGDVVFNGGLYLSYRNQFLANDNSGAATSQNLGVNGENLRAGYQRRSFSAWMPDLWVQVLYKKFRFDAEAVTIQGKSDTVPGGDYPNPQDRGNPGYKFRQWGAAAQAELKAVEDRLRINFGTGWASGDPESTTIVPNTSGFTSHANANKRTYSQFRFHPNYRVDLILFRHILNRVQGAYYLRPSVEYDFSRSPNGQRLGGGAAVIWSRASEFVQTPGHRRDLGVEIDLTLYYQSKDGALNDDPDKMGGFFTMIQYGVLFPLWGMDYMPGEKDTAKQQNVTLGTSAAQTLRWYCGILF